MDALILAGGLGTRLATVVADRAKPVAEVGGQPFLAYLLAQLECCKAVDRAVLCVGHKSETVAAALGGHCGRLPLHFSRETRPLGTGGAMRQALRTLKPPGAVFSMNGDSFLGIRLQRLLDFHHAARQKATLALARVEDGSRFGAARLEGRKVVAFSEKATSGRAWINAGIYVLSARAIADLLRGPAEFSFERDVLPRWCAEGVVAGMKSRARFIDIGIPADYARSGSFFGKGR